MLSHMLDVRGPRIDERHVLAGLYHMGADIAAHRTRSDNGYPSAHTFLPAFWATLTLRPRAMVWCRHRGSPSPILACPPFPRLIRRHGRTLYPIAAILSLRSGDATARAISRYERSTISRGVPAGAQTHCGASCT